MDSGIGPLLLAATATGLVTVAFHARPAVRDAALDRLRTRFGTEPVAAPGSARLAEPIRELAAYFAGEPRDLGLALTGRWPPASTVRCSASWRPGCRTGRSSGTASWPRGWAGRRGPRRWARPWGPTRCRWWCRVTGWWRATGAWADSAGVWRPSGSCWRWRGAAAAAVLDGSQARVTGATARRIRHQRPKLVECGVGRDGGTVPGQPRGTGGDECAHRRGVVLDRASRGLGGRSVRRVNVTRSPVTSSRIA